MSDDKTKNPPEADAAKGGKQLTAADAAKRVKRTVFELVDGKDDQGKAIKVPKPKEVAVAASEVLAFRDYGSHVVVVTRDGQKFSSAE